MSIANIFEFYCFMSDVLPRILNQPLQMHLNYDLKHLICCRLFYIEKTLARKNMKNVSIERIYEKPDNFIGMFIITELQFDLA